MEILYLIFFIPYIILALLIVFVIALGPLLFSKGHTKLGLMTTIFVTIPLTIFMVNELIIRPNQFESVCFGKGLIVHNPIEASQIALDIKHHAPLSGITIDNAVEKVISGNFEEIEVINTQSVHFQKIVEKYGLARRQNDNEAPEVFVFSTANKGSSDCWWHDFIDTSTQSWKNPARATKHFKWAWDKANPESNKCISLQYRNSVSSRYVVEIKEDHLSKYNFSKYSIVVRDTLFENSVISEKIGFRIHPSTPWTGALMNFNSEYKDCPQNPLYGDHLRLFFNLDKPKIAIPTYLLTPKKPLSKGLYLEPETIMNKHN
jgi:hypothetical protein